MSLLRRNLLLSAVLGSLNTAASAAVKKAGGAPRRMPVLFVGHGSPMNALSDNGFTRHLAAWGKALPRPTAILVVSAHWLTPGKTLAGVQARPQTIHDFGGFPPELHAMQYPAPGHPQTAKALEAALPSVPVLTDSSWGLDHGTWTVLKHMYPAADIPVLQLSIDYAQMGGFHLELGKQLRFLRDKGVLILGSGNVVHNLRATVSGAPESTRALAGWAQDFDDAVVAALEQDDRQKLARFDTLKGAALAVPTPDHYWPFLYALGAAAPGEQAKTTYASFQAGTLSMRCLQWG